jgi:AraC family transcriptional regulator
LKDFLALIKAVEVIEENLCEEMTREYLATQSYVSLSKLEKLFRFALNCSIKEYITKRRITLAAEDLKNGAGSVTEIAVKYCYTSSEVFCRVFKSIWGVSPSLFALKWRFTGIFPKRDPMNFLKGEDIEMARKRVDISDAYDFFKQQAGTFVICFDIQSLMPINEISIKAGDIAILETASRINDIMTDDMLLLRIGGDEFALFTGLRELSQAKTLLDAVLARNGDKFNFNGQGIPLTVWAGITTVPDTSLRYSEFFSDMHGTIQESKEKGDGRKTASKL